MLTHMILIIGTLLVGLVVGSFMNVVIVRYPIMLRQRQTPSADCDWARARHEHKAFNLMIPRSHCPQCQTLIPWWYNIPVISYLLLKGRCASCHQSISRLYPVVEILSAIVAITVVTRYGVTGPGVCALVFSWGLIVLAMIDWRAYLLPDSLTVPLLWLGLLSNAFSFYTTPSQAILGALGGYLVLWLVAKLFLMLRKKEGMGAGDLKMLAMLGAWNGVFWLPNIVLISTAIALAVALVRILQKKMSFETPLPFGTFLALGGWLTFWWGPLLTDALNQFFAYV